MLCFEFVTARIEFLLLHEYVYKQFTSITSL
jgi:hypothetical protein